MHGSREPRPSVPVLFYPAVALWLGILLLFDSLAPSLPKDLGEESESTIRLVADSVSGTYGTYAYAAVEGGSLAGQRVRVSFDDGGTYYANERISCTLSLTAFDDEDAAEARRKGCVARGSASGISLAHDGSVLDSLTSFRRSCIESLMADEDESATLLRALVLGEKTQLYDSDCYRAMQVCGLAHLVAVSGAHLSFAISFLSLLLLRLRFPRRVSAIVLAVYVAAYVVMTGCAVSVLRAALMSVTALMSIFGRRRSSGLSALCLSVIIVLCWDPTEAFSLSFALSVLSTFSIIVFSPLASVWIGQVKALPDTLVGAMSLTLCTTLFTLPIAASTFGRLPLVSLPANLVAGPFAALIIPLGGICVIASVVLPWARDLLLMLPLLLCGVFAGSFELLSSFPWCSMPISGSFLMLSFALAVGSLLVWITWPQPGVRASRALVGGAFAVAVALLAAGLTGSGERIVMLDVGQGDAILLQSGGSNVLIDTGNQDAKLLQALARAGVTRLDAIIISHPDDDHCGSITALRGTVDIGMVIVSEFMTECPCSSCSGLIETIGSQLGCEIHEVACGEEISFGNFDLEVVWPHEYVDEGGNADSLCLLATYGDSRLAAGAERNGVTALFVGDAEDEQLDGIIDEQGISSLDVYKVGHHGSAAAIDDQTADDLSPTVSLISVGEGNSYGHPASSTVTSLESAGSEVFRTDESGDITVYLDESGFTVGTLR